MNILEYTKGLHRIGDGVYAYLQPDGSWGWSNAGLVVDGTHSLLIDTLFDLPLTREMLDAIGAETGVSSFETVVITHSNGDHCFGNELVGGAEIIASKACSTEIAEMPPELLAGLVDAAPGLGEIGAYITESFGAFAFHGITLTPPTRTFSGELEIEVGAKKVRLIEVGPAHTRGDILVHLPEEGVLFASDILFIGGTPIMWAGPVVNFTGALDRILDLRAKTIVPGHGPITDTGGVKAVRGYFEHIRDEARRCFEAGIPAAEAAAAVDLGPYASLGNPERIVINVHTLYREFGSEASASVAELVRLMAEYVKK